ncbi:MAG: tetratricopeptide repeat protein [Candidatus Hydrogenedentes bacterium]|nr:tetratricopeptide repeat protein [Candidatus Hydrogenedentota bacterium]
MMKPEQKSMSVLLPVCALLVIVAALYWPALSFDFTNYDDDDYVTENPFIQRGFTMEMIRWSFTTAHAANWHPLTWMSHAIDWQLSGAKPGLHHATNILFHAINAALLYTFLFRATNARGPSFVVALIFAVHPFNVETVAWVSERKNVLSTFFGLLSLVAYVGYAKHKKRSTYIIACITFALGLMSKPMLVTWPFVMLLLDYWPLSRIKTPLFPVPALLREMKPLIKEKIPFFGLIVALSVITYLVQSRGGAVGSVDAIPMIQRVGNALVSYRNYVVMTIWPFGNAAFYPHPFHTLPVWKAALCLAVLIAISMVVVRAGRTKRYLVTGWFYYLGTLVPVIGIVQVGSQAMADRYAYVPILGLFIMAAWGAMDIAARLKVSPRTLTIAAGLVILLLAARTWNQLPHWRNSIALWERAVAVTKDNYIAHNNLGSAYLRTNQHDRALLEFTESLRIRPTHPGALVNMGRVFLDSHKAAEAAQLFEKAISLEPRRVSANLNLAIAYFQMNQIDRALTQAKLTQHIDSEDPKVYNLLGVLSNLSGRPDEAVKYLQIALQIDPNYANAKTNLQRILNEKKSKSTP